MSFAFWQRYLWTLEAILGEIFGGFWPKFSEAFGRNFRRLFWVKFLEVNAKCSNIYDFNQIFKVISQEEMIQEWINLTIYSKLFLKQATKVDNFDHIFKVI